MTTSITIPFANPVHPTPIITITTNCNATTDIVTNIITPGTCNIVLLLLFTH